MKSFNLVLSLGLSCVLIPAYSQITRFEKSGGTETATYFEAIDWYRNLDKSSSRLLLKQMGMTDAGYPLHLALLASDGSADPVKWKQKNKIVILVNNGIHPGEPDGIDASMMLARDIVKGTIKLPDNVAIAFIPVYNIGGCLNRNAYTRVNQNGPVEYGFRGNSQNLDLNRDFTKADSKDAKAFTEIFHYLSPHILIDNHVSDGADYQHTMTLISSQYDKLGEPMGSFLRNSFEPALYESMSKKGWTLIPYVDFDNTDFSKGMRMFYDPPRYSSGYAALFGTLGFMPETHMLKPYRERVKSTYDLMVSFIENAGRDAKELIQNKEEALKKIKSQSRFPLKWIPDNSESRQVDFSGYERDSARSEATGLNKMFYNHQKPFQKKITFFDKYIKANEIEKPKAYVIPRGWQDVIDRLRLNRVKVSELTADTLINVTAYRIDEYKSMAAPYERHHKNYSVKTSSANKSIKFLKGDYLVYLNQDQNRYLVEMLEPTGDDSFFAWNFFDAILQQKEGYSDYRWEELAADVLRKDPVLKEKLETKKAGDSSFARNSAAILDFIYRNSPYYEMAHLQYPVYRIENQ